jgi:hypothetical protein
MNASLSALACSPKARFSARQKFISALIQDSGDAPMFNRDTNSTQSNVGVKSKDQSSANALNRVMVRYFDDTWSNAYEQTDLPDSLAKFAEAAEVAYGTKITAVRPTGRKFNIFNGINVGKTNYINIESYVSFVNITGPELYHDIERNSPATTGAPLAASRENDKREGSGLASIRRI